MSKRERKNPTVGNKNEAPMQDAGTGQVLDNTDNKGGHLDQVEYVSGSDTRLRPGPASDPVEGNSNVETDPRAKVSVGAGAFENPDPEREANRTTSGENSESDANDESDGSGSQADESQADHGDDASSDAQASEGDAQGQDVSTQVSETDPPADDDAGQDDGLQPSDEGQAQESSGSEEPEPDDESDPTPVTLGKDEAKDLADADLRALYARILPEDALQGWDYNTLYMYHMHRVQPEKTVRGNWPVDVRRQRSLVDWSSDELLDWMDGNFKAPNGVVESDLWDEIYNRFRLPGNWSTETVKKYITSGDRPEYTSNGVLKEDRSRGDKTVHHWTYLELRSALLGEIDTDFTKEELLDQLRRRLGLSDNFSGSRLLEQLPEMPTEANVDNVLLKSKLEEYKAAMTKNGSNLTDTTAGLYQVSLYKAIRSVMARDTQDFFEGWNILLDWVNENYTALFVPEKARRGWARMSVSKSASSTFEDLMTLMIQTRRPANRTQEAKVYSLDHILRYVTSEQERSNVITYYHS